MNPFSLTHVVHTIKIKSSSDLYIAQPITLESMKKAKLFAIDDINVTLASVQYSDACEVTPNFITKTSNLKKSILDYYNFQKKLRLPLIQDIISKSVSTFPKEDYYIYTNIDITLMPHFYSTINKLISSGIDAIAINRKTIRNDLDNINDLPLLYSEIGKPHEGIDCFVFSNYIAKQMVFYNTFIGSGPVGMAFVINMLALSNKFLWLQKSDLTFHLGDNKAWKDKTVQDYEYFNFNEVIKICNFFLNKQNTKPNLSLLIKLLKEQFELLKIGKPTTCNIHKLLGKYCENPGDFHNNYENEMYKSNSIKSKLKKIFKQN